MILTMKECCANIYVNEIDEFNNVFDELFNEMNTLGANFYRR